MSNAWRKVDMASRGCAYHIGADDLCCYLMDYVNGGYSKSDANQKVFNLKKPMARKGQPDWHHKQDAIASFANDLSSFLSRLPLDLGRTVIVPMPTSKHRDDSHFDDRLVQVCQLASDSTGIAMVDCFDVRESIVPSHKGGTRSVAAIMSNLKVRAPELLGQYDLCILVDDVLSTGAHYIACRDLLTMASPDLDVVAAFWAKWEPIDDDGFVYEAGPF